MKKRLLAALLMLAMMFSLVFSAMPMASAAEEEPKEIAGVLDIDLDEDNKGPEISEDLIGLFFEDINYGADGGLYAELVQNRSFEYYYYRSSPNSNYHTYSWSAVDGSTIAAISDGTGMNANNTYFARVTTNGANQGIANTGWTRESTSISSVTATTTYDTGIYLESGKFYDFSIWVKGPVVTDITAQVVIAGTDDVVASCKFNAGQAADEGWQKLEGIMQANQTTLKGSLEVLFADAGTYDIDFVSLFPQHTYNNRKNGLRADMVQILKDINPGFLRFPGGCVVEGNNLSNRYQWKLSVGPVEERKVNWNRWQSGTNRAYVYHQSLGLGFYEYMLLCEDLNTKAVPVLNCGMGCQYQTADVCGAANLQQYIDDAIDWIEFCNGDPATNEWAALRAEMGHPEPFGLEYLAIGNEQWNQTYFNYYDQFQAQIAPLYPEIKLLSTTGPNLDSSYWTNAKAWLADKDRTHSWGYDEHYYLSENDLLNTHFDRYADETKYPRTEGYPYVFAGEYACHSGNAPTRAMTLRQALVEAAYMTTFEKNADVVKLTAYAPLFGKETQIQWNPNLIYASNHYVYGQPNYWSQWMYANNLGTYQLENKMSEYDPEATPEEPTVKYEKGSIGIGTWLTSASFRNLKVTDNETGEVLLQDDLTTMEGDFYSNTVNHATAGSWSVRNGYVTQTSTSAENVAKIYKGGYDWQNYTYEVEAMKTGGGEGFLFPFLYASGNDYYWFNVAGWGNTLSCIEKGSSTTSRTQPGGQISHQISNNTWYKFKIEVTADLTGNTYKCYINDQPFQTYKQKESSGPSGTYAGIYNSASYDEEAKEIIVKLINYNNSEKTVRVNLNNFDGYINPTGRVIWFGGQALTSANNGNNQLNVSAKEEEYTGFAESFDYTLPMNSFVTLRIPTVSAGDYIKSIAPVEITTDAGVVPEYPSTVQVTYGDGSTDTVAVEWESKPDSLYSHGGEYSVLGEVDGTKLSAEAIVTVVGSGNPDNPDNPELSDEELEQLRLEAIAKKLDIPHADNVKGNITLVDSIDDATITWTSSNESIVSTEKKINENYDDGPAGFVTRPAEDTKVILTATITRDGKISLTKTFDLTVKAAVEAITAEDTDYYLQMYFTDPTKNIFFATAEDGFNYTVLRDGKPMFSAHGDTNALISQTLGTQGLRDPFMMRSHEGDKFFIMATDLDASGGDWGAYATQGSDSLVFYESDDLVNWSDGRLIAVATDPNFGCTWAPEAIYDEMTGEYLVYFSCHDLAAGKKQVYYVKTRDFRNFTEPEVWVPYWDGYDTGIIDTTCYYDEETGTYYRFTKNEYNNRPFVDTTTGNLLSDTWVRGEVTVQGTGNYALEGQNMFKLHPSDVPEGYDDVVLLIDEYSGTNRGFIPFVTKSLESLVFEIAPDYTKPTNAKHGAVIPVTEEEYNALMEAYGPEPAPEVTPSEAPILYYDFDAANIDGTTIKDMSGNGNDGTLMNGAAVTADDTPYDRGEALYMYNNNVASSSSAGQYVNMPTQVISQLSDITITVWYQETLSGGNSTRFSRVWDFGTGPSSTGNDFFYYTTQYDWSAATGNGCVGITNTGNDGEFSSSFTTAPRAVNVWRNATFVIEGNKMTFYLDGKEYKSVKGLNVFPYMLSYNAAFLGRSMWDDDRYFTGYMDDFAIFNRALSADEIAGIYETGEMPGMSGEAEYSLAADKDIYLVNEEITLTATTGTDVARLGIFNEAGKGISQLSAEYVDKGATRTWTVTVKMGTKGNRTLSAKALKDGETFADVEAFGTVDLVVVKEVQPETEPVKPEIISVEAPETAQAKQAFTFTVKTTQAVANVGLFNESGAGISTSKSYVDEGDVRIWTVNTNVSSRGARVLTVKIAEVSNNWLDISESFNITLTK